LRLMIIAKALALFIVTAVAGMVIIMLGPRPA
jgi:hypothetical protein